MYFPEDLEDSPFNEDAQKMAQHKTRQKSKLTNLHQIKNYVHVNKFETFCGHIPAKTTQKNVK